MEITSESNETLAPDSVLMRDGNDFYCVIADGSDWKVGKFDSNLILKLKSDVNVKSSTPITITDSGVVITDSNGMLRLLNKADLKSITKDSSGVDAK